MSPSSARVAIIGREWSLQFPGYRAGAVDAATRGVQACLAVARSAAS